jgi:hypothetical protein
MTEENPQECSQPSESLQDSKLRVEIAKLKLETDALKNPFKRFTSWVPIVVAMVSVAGFVLQWQASTLKAERAAFEAARELAVVQGELAVVQGDLSAKKQKLQEYRVKLLDNVVKNLDKTRAAVLNYQRDWRQITVFRDSNRAVEELLALSLELGLLPAGLTDDFEQLRDHYREWFVLYRVRFPDGIPGPHDDLVFVGSFPASAERSIKDCLRSLLSGADDCDA